MWTLTALASEHRTYQGKIWRLVEGQHRISTNRLARDGATQALLEELAAEVKPMVPKGARHLHFLVATPFRYGHGSASRFRRANERPGIFYAAEAEATAIAETAYWSLRFFSRSPGFSPPTTTVEYTSFYVRVATDRALDLTLQPFASQEAHWIAPDDYAACQDLAAQARETQAALLRTLSARASGRQCNIVVLAPEAFEDTAPTIHRTWHFRYQNGYLTVLGASLPRSGMSSPVLSLNLESRDGPPCPEQTACCATGKNEGSSTQSIARFELNRFRLLTPDLEAPKNN